MVEHALSKPCPRGQSHEGACKLPALPKQDRAVLYNKLTETTSGINGFVTMLRLLEEKKDGS